MTLTSFIWCSLAYMQAFSAPMRPDFQAVNLCLPAVGVACESSPACPHWSRAGRRGVSVLQQLTWCSAEGLLESSLSIPLPPFSAFP